MSATCLIACVLCTNFNEGGDTLTHPPKPIYLEQQGKTLVEGRCKSCGGYKENKKIMMLLTIGEYRIPDNCKAVVYGNRLQIVAKSIPQLKNLRCKDCKHYSQGFVSINAEQSSFVCHMKPKNCKHKELNIEIYYSAMPYAKPCNYFEKRDV